MGASQIKDFKVAPPFYNKEHGGIHGTRLTNILMLERYLKKMDSSRCIGNLLESIVVYKATYKEGSIIKCITELLIPKGSIVHLGEAFESTENYYNATMTVEFMCRSNSAIVLSQFYMGDDGSPQFINRTVSLYDRRFVYETGKLVQSRYEMNLEGHECNTGIHWFVAEEHCWIYHRLFATLAKNKNIPFIS
jgi:hypothetical protein